MQLNGAQEGVTPKKAQEYFEKFKGGKLLKPIEYDGGPTAQARSIFEVSPLENYTASYLYRYSLALALVPFSPRKAQKSMKQM